MKRFLLSILMVVIGLSAFSQSPSRQINLRPAYPIAIGESTIDGIVLSNNGLYTDDIIQDSLPQYEIGQIFSQTVYYTEEGHGFYVRADSLHSVFTTYSYEVNEQPNGTIEFNEKTGRFKYYPAAEDYKTFVVTFHATNGTESISEDVEFNILAQTLPEVSSFQSRGTMPTATDYTIVAETSKTMFLNNMERTAYSVSVSGKDVVFDENLRNKVWGLIGREDIYELNIYAETLTIGSALSFPQTNITVYAREMVFEDHETTTSCISTTPSKISTLVNETQAADGGNAGNITLYINSLKANMAKRFFLNGAKGQSANRNGTPGNGGNGGTIASTIDVSNYCDFARGSGGVKYDVSSNDPSSAGAVIATGQIGLSGQFELINEPYAYLHPYYISAVMRHANDAFINNYTEYALQVCKDYHSLIEDYTLAPEWASCSEENEVELNNDLTEIDDMLLRLEQGLDYFGNPVGWVPLLSFEVMLANYDNEIDRAIPTLYMYYWLSRVDQTLQRKIEASQFAASVTKQAIEQGQDDINTLILEVPNIQDQIAEVESMIAETKKAMQALEAKLLSKAKRSIKKKNRIKKAVSICSSVINCIPVYGAAISTAVNAVANVAFATNLFGTDNTGLTSAFSTASTIDYDILLSNLKKAYSNISFDSLGKDNKNTLKKTFDSISNEVKAIVSNIQKVSNALSSSSTPVDEVTKVLDDLKKESHEWQALDKALSELTTKKADLDTKLLQTFSNIMTTVSEVNDNMVALDAFRRDVFTGNSKRDLNAMQYLEKMEQKAKNRLLKYHYYLRKAYEYRLLKPYVGEFNLVSMFDRFETLGMALDSVINEAAYVSLGSIFRDVVSEMAEKIIDEYAVNYPEQSAPITIVIPREQLDVINGDGSLILNFHEMGVFAPDEENVRIVNLGIQHIETHVDGSVGYSGYMDLNMTHSGISKFRKDGQLYWFDHMSRTSTSPHTWGLRYDAVSKESTTIQPSAASESLLSSIIKNGNNIMLFSRPAAWSDISISKKVHTSGGGKIIVDSLVLRLQYDFTRRPNNLRNIDITVNEELLPYIACSEKDINGRSNGNGNLYRSYRMGSQPVTFTAIEKYGTYHFINWTDRSGKIVSEKPDLTVNKMTDQFYTANYERRVPILSVPDTIKVSHHGGIYTVKVGNAGSGDLEMDWYVSDSLSTWVHLNDIAEGIDDGHFKFIVEANPTRLNRLDSLEIFAPETDMLSKMIYIAQVDDGALNIDKIAKDDTDIQVFPNPMRDYVSIMGKNLLSAQIYALSGREVIRQELGGYDSATIDVNNLPNGVYIILVKTEDGTASRKLLKVY